MSSLSLICGIYLLFMFTGIKFFVLKKKYSSIKDCFMGLFTLPSSPEKRDEMFLAISQFVALLWIIQGIIIKMTSLQSILFKMPFGHLIGYVILMTPALIFILILRWLSNKH